MQASVEPSRRCLSGIMGLNDTAWENLFDKYHILAEIERNGQFTISANQIKEFREPRLMTKFDHKVNLPTIFAENQLAILPVTRGDYVISSFSAYKEFEQPSTDVQRISIPAHIQSLMPQFLVSEAIALNCANACGILEDFLEDEALVATVSGRMSSGEFNFNIDSASGTERCLLLIPRSKSMLHTKESTIFPYLKPKGICQMIFLYASYIIRFVFGATGLLR